MSAQRILLIPEILENIFSYIPHEEHLFQLFMVNYTWYSEGVQSLLKWYRNMFYRYNNNFNLILLINQFEGLECCNIYKPVYKKIYWPTEDEYNYTHDLDKEDKLKNISSEIEDIIEYLKMIKDYIPSILYAELRKDIVNLTNNYQSLEDKIQDILNYLCELSFYDE